MESLDPAQTLAPSPVATPTRSLSTARSVLRVLALLVERPSGVRADEVARRLGKSTSTAYYLLSSLCEEGFAVHEAKGVYRPAHDFEEHLLAAPEEPPATRPDALRPAVEELFTLTRRRAYAGVVHPGRIEIVAFRGRQGVPRVPGLGSEITDSAHALALGKVVLAELDPEALRRYGAGGLRRFTEHTITAPEPLADELAQVRRDGYAVDCEEFDAGFCCVAAPIRDARGRFCAVLGLSVGVAAFTAEREHLAELVVGVARRTSVDAPHRGATARRDRLHLASVS